MSKAIDEACAVPVVPGNVIIHIHKVYYLILVFSVGGDGGAANDGCEHVQHTVDPDTCVESGLQERIHRQDQGENNRPQS
jgi:hypothetical protein